MTPKADPYGQQHRACWRVSEWVRIASLAFAVGCVNAALVGAASASPCRKPADAEVIRSSGHAAVYAAPLPSAQAGSDRERFYGCARPNGRVRRLFDIDSDGGLVRTEALQFRLAGTFFAVVITSVDHYGGVTKDVLAFDLSGRHARRKAFAGSGQVGGAGGAYRSVSVQSLQLDSRGAIAWLTRDYDYGTSRYRDRLLSVERMLDSGDAMSISAVSLRRHRLSWRHGNELRSLRLPPFWVTT
jgi:hypothetical protein